MRIAQSRRRAHRGRLTLVGCLLLGLLGGFESAARGDSISALTQSINQLSNQLALEQRQSDILSQKYDAAAAQLSNVQATLSRLTAQVKAKQIQIDVTTSQLVKSVVYTYVFGVQNSPLLEVFNKNANRSDARNVYDSLVLGDLQSLSTTYRHQEQSLQATVALEAVQRDKAAAAERQIQSLVAQHDKAVRSTQTALNVMKTKYRNQVVAYEITVAVGCVKAHNNPCINSAVAVAGQVGGNSASNQVIAAVNAAMAALAVSVSQSSASSVQGLRALNAAKTQQGLPYIWGGETAGLGFDCSGLTQWAWRQAGYSIPRTASQQYYGMAHVPLNSLQPGDLLFYFNLDGDHQVDHVVMYVGQSNGQNYVIAAARTGTLIGIHPLYTFGLYGAGRP